MKQSSVVSRQRRERAFCVLPEGNVKSEVKSGFAEDRRLITEDCLTEFFLKTDD